MSTCAQNSIVSYHALVCRILATEREKKGLDQESVAKAVGINRSTWSRIENGESALTIDQLAKACKALDRLPSDLLKQADEMSQSLERTGIRVSGERPKGNDNGMNFLVGAGLTAFLLAALAKK